MHSILIGAPRDLPGGHKPVILQRTDDDFIESTLDDLRTASGRASLKALRAQATNKQGVLKLFQPIQRQFHLALIEAWCDTPGEPRIDPARVESAGMVLRRVQGNSHEGWMHSKGRARGWLPLTRVGGDRTDPGAALRLKRGLTGVADIDRKLTGFALERADSLLNEHVIPLYMAPPDVCSEAGKTVFYGMVPTISGELCETGPVFAAAGDNSFGPDTDFFIKHLVEALRGEAMNFAYAGETVQAGWFEAVELPRAVPPEGLPLAQFTELIKDAKDSNTVRRMKRFVLLLRQLGSEFNVFDGGQEVDDLRSELKKIQLPLKLKENETTRRYVEAYDFLHKASRLLLENDKTVGSFEMPESWPELSATHAAKLRKALSKGMQARFVAMKGKAGRFDEPDARYAVRAFVRLKPDCGCEGRIVWSDYSEPFVIAAWYEGAGAPPVQIPLPDASDRSLLKSLKPNVAFVVPPSMQNLLSGKTKDLMEGKGSTSGPGLAWICGFNIPVITICAFIVLNIFLTLLHLVFGWLFFIKICIPFPKLGNKPPAG
ncbi:hypothetical protein VVD49_06380 [Uliginosibacterium sp. H3]|uniref:Uncharacterized protein n=1 Tax=Uliginosibacterium silvisoli TaxID=3114758 RepID=A0ABU6K1P3_9RHOO|nr:hypothetical protein [Uliginosibacterium sp. H3]